MSYEKKIIRKELIKNMIYNLILFTILFAAFSAIISYAANRFMYLSVDNQLKEIRSRLSVIKKDVYDKNDYSNTENSESQIIIGEETNLTSDIERVRKEINNRFGEINDLKVIVIFRNGNGEILGTSYRNDLYANYFYTMNFDKKNINKIYDFSINQDTFYRGTDLEIEGPSGEKYYLNLFINTNSEKEMVDRFIIILSISTAVAIIISIFISYLLANKSIKPIARSYERQTEFIQNASHELRTPLTIIQAKQEMLLKSPNSKIIDKSEDIALTLNESRRLSKMVSELMDLARDDANKTLLNIVKADINSIIDEIAIPYQEMVKMENKELNIIKDCKNLIKVDINKFKELLIIVLDNAIKYTEEGDKIELNARTQDDKLFISVKDTGIGVSDEALKHIFDRFYREDKARSREKGGSGLGLSIAQTIVKNHGGTIKIVHNNPKGIIVQIKL